MPALCAALAREQSLTCLNTRLVGRRYEVARAIAAHSDLLVRALQPSWQVTAARTVAEACEGASIVVLVARIGGLEARAHERVLLDDALAERVRRAAHAEFLAHHTRQAKLEQILRVFERLVSLPS